MLYRSRANATVQTLGITSIYKIKNCYKPPRSIIENLIELLDRYKFEIVKRNPVRQISPVPQWINIQVYIRDNMGRVEGQDYVNAYNVLVDTEYQNVTKIVTDG